MSAPPVTLKDASLRLRDASKQRYQMLREQASVYYTQSGPYMKESWERYRPRTLLQWTVRMIASRDQLTVQTKHIRHTFWCRKVFISLSVATVLRLSPPGSDPAASATSAVLGLYPD